MPQYTIHRSEKTGKTIPIDKKYNLYENQYILCMISLTCAYEIYACRVFGRKK